MKQNNKDKKPSTYPGYEMYKNCDYPLIKNEEPIQTESHFELDENGDTVIVTDKNWKINGNSRSMQGIYINDGKDNIGQVYTSLPNSEATAKLIVEAVNNYQSLKDSNRELIKVAEWALQLCDTISKSKYKSKILPEAATLGVNLDEAIQKAKQLVITI